MSNVPEAVRRQALHFSALPPSPGFALVEGDYVFAGLHHFPIMVPIEPRDGLKEADVGAAIRRARQLVRDHGRTDAVWITGPDHPWLANALGDHGLISEDSVGFESVENAMALVRPPAGDSNGEVHTSIVESFEDFAECQRVQMTVFDVPAEGRAKLEAEMDEHFARFATAGNPFKLWSARLEGRVVGAAGAVLGDAGINLYGGGVLPEARGRGVYRALVRARWDFAVRCGTPALTVQAGRMSRPVLEPLGFGLIAEMPMYVDDFGPAAA